MVRAHARPVIRHDCACMAGGCLPPRALASGEVRASRAAGVDPLCSARPRFVCEIRQHNPCQSWRRQWRSSKGAERAGTAASQSGFDPGGCRGLRPQDGGATAQRAGGALLARLAELEQESQSLTSRERRNRRPAGRAPWAKSAPRWAAEGSSRDAARRRPGERPPLQPDLRGRPGRSSAHAGWAMWTARLGAARVRGPDRRRDACC